MHVNKKISPHMSKNNMTSSHVNCKMTATHACTVLFKHKIGVTQVKKQMAATQVTKKITFIGRVGGYCGVSPPDCYICKTTGRFLGSNPPLPCNAVP